MYKHCSVHCSPACRGQILPNSPQKRCTEPLPSTSCGICPGAYCLHPQHSIHRGFSCSPQVPYSLLCENGISAPWNKKENNSISSRYIYFFFFKRKANHSVVSHCSEPLFNAGYVTLNIHTGGWQQHHESDPGAGLQQVCLCHSKAITLPSCITFDS